MRLTYKEESKLEKNVKKLMKLYHSGKLDKLSEKKKEQFYFNKNEMDYILMHDKVYPEMLYNLTLNKTLLYPVQRNKIPEYYSDFYPIIKKVPYFFEYLANNRDVTAVYKAIEIMNRTPKDVELKEYNIYNEFYTELVPNLTNAKALKYLVPILKKQFDNKSEVLSIIKLFKPDVLFIPYQNDYGKEGTVSNKLIVNEEINDYLKYALKNNYSNEFKEEIQAVLENKKEESIFKDWDMAIEENKQFDKNQQIKEVENLKYEL